MHNKPNVNNDDILLFLFIHMSYFLSVCKHSYAQNSHDISPQVLDNFLKFVLVLELLLLPLNTLCILVGTFILVAIISANQSESKFLSLPPKSCQNVSQENQSFNFLTRKDMQLLIDWFPWETNLISWFLIGWHKWFLPNWIELPAKIQKRNIWSPRELSTSLAKGGGSGGAGVWNYPG